jgi:dUTP pyrophosphatase
MDTVSIRVQRTTDNASLPRVMQPGDVAADLTASQAVTIPARGRALVPTGLVLELPEGFRARVHSRSGLSLKHGIEAGAGLIDQGYRHEVGVLLYNHSETDFEVLIGDRIAQLCIERYTHPTFVEVSAVERTERTAGWGSSGQQ